MRGDAGILSFHDAISYYMAEDDVLCIMSLSITVEILGNKRRKLKGERPTLRRKPALLPSCHIGPIERGTA